MRWIDLWILALATHQLVNLWRFSSLLAGWREWIETGRHQGEGEISSRIAWWLTALHGCPWCLSVNLAGVCWWVYYWLPDLRWLVVVLAVSQAANLIHHLTGHQGPKLNS